jgi:signal transduction histidine kinase/CheY-like chemotaxis protein
MIKNAIKRSISRKFMLAVLATTCTALLVSGAAMLIYDIQTYRTTWVNDLTTQSDILAKISLPALEFNDPKAARENLAQLKARPGIFAAAIYAPDGTVFATYSRDESLSSDAPRRPKSDGYNIVGSRISIFKSITRNGETAGAVYLGAQYPLADRIKRYLSILAAVMTASLIVATLVSAWLQAAVTRPILAVTEAVHQVLRRRDFSMRVKKSTEDEVGVLVDAFNGMLAEVGSRAEALEGSNQSLQHEMKERLDAERALQQLNNTLEERITARTAELERAHEQLRQAQKMEAIGQLTGGVAHDFNNVLQVISGNLQLLQMSLAGNPQAQRRLETAAFAADRGAKLSSQLLAFARRQPLQPVPTHLGRILRGMDELLRRALGESIQVETIVTGGLWNTLVDPNQIENVILNLAINARDAMKSGGKLTLELGNAMLDDHYVSTEPEVHAGQYVLLAISDTGTGMPPDIMARAFEPFFTTKREGEGTGLGLSMAYGFVKQSNGHIKIYSEVGSGTTIKIYLPRSFKMEVEVANTLTDPVVGGAETILVVEDDAAVQATAVDILTGLGYRVLKAHDGESALAILKSRMPIDLLFTDVVMPGPIRSPDLARQAKQFLPDIEVLFTSGYTQNAIVHGGRLDPGVELISKPYRREDLARKIRHLFANRQLISFADEASIHDVDADTFAEAAAPLSILVVEDNEDTRKMVCELLMMMGHRVQGDSNAEDALDALATKKFDVLFTDVTLPGMSGVELARKAIIKAPALKIIFASGYGAISSSDFGFESISLPKPYDFKRLQQVLADIASD